MKNFPFKHMWVFKHECEIYVQLWLGHQGGNGGMDCEKYTYVTQRHFTLQFLSLCVYNVNSTNFAIILYNFAQLLIWKSWIKNTRSIHGKKPVNYNGKIMCVSYKWESRKFQQKKLALNSVPF
jgi:hypothetical protein